MAMKVCKLRAEHPPPEATIFPVVRVRPRFGTAWGPPGSGFFIRSWQSSIITARHVVAPRGQVPTLVRIIASANGKSVVMDGSCTAYDDHGPDVAVIRVNGFYSSPLEAADPAAVRVEIWGYPAGTSAVRRIRGGSVLSPPWLGLTASGPEGMSGGPVLYAPGDAAPSYVLGIFLGDKVIQGRERTVAYPLSDPSVIACKDATVSAA